MITAINGTYETHCEKNLSSGFSTRSDSNQDVQPQNMAECSFFLKELLHQIFRVSEYLEKNYSKHQYYILHCCNNVFVQ